MTPDPKRRVLSCKNVNFSYKNPAHNTLALKNVNFDVMESDFLAIIGPNGGGKTTLLKLLLGNLAPTSGEILRENDQNFGYVPQITNINRNFPIQVIDVVKMGFLQKKSWFTKTTPDPVTQEKIAMNFLEELEIAHLANEKIGNLSGGQNQRVLIARALCGQNNGVLIFDEPTSNIDKNMQQNIYKILKKYNSTHTIILVSHDLSILLHYAHKVLFVNQETVFHDLDFDENSRTNLLRNFNHLCEADILNHFIRGENAKRI